jgi:membrane fusion protein, multidrug efflux system
MLEPITPSKSTEKPSDAQETKRESPEQPEIKVEPPKEDQKAEKAARVNKILSYAVPILILLLAIGLWALFTANWKGWEAGKSVQTTDNATIQADIIPLSTRSIGIIENVNIEDFQRVKKGDVLITLRSNEAQATVDQAQAGIRATQESLQNIRIQQEQHEDRIKTAETGIEVAQADLRAAKAGIEATDADVIRTTEERKRQQSMFDAQATTKQRLELAIADNDRVLASLKARREDQSRAEHELTVRRDELAIALKQREILRVQEKQLQEDVKAKEASLVLANTNFDYTKILAPRDGFVSEVKVKPGQLLGPGAQVASLVSREMWVIANFKETQVAHMKENDPAEIVLDAFPRSKVKGRISAIAPASGSEFSALPPENTSGSYTRVVQRVPVKIVFDSDEALASGLRPGMSVTATVRIRNKN